MDASSVLSALDFDVAASSLFGIVNSPQKEEKSRLPTPSEASSKLSAVSCTSPSTERPVNSLISPHDDGYNTPTRVEIEKENRSQVPVNRVQMTSSCPSPVRATGKRQLQVADERNPFGAKLTKRKGSSDYLRKGQWTNTEERLARLLIEAFEEGYLPIYTGIRLRGYLAVQLQCDPMRVSKKLCAGTIDGKQIPKNYGQKKFKLRKKAFWDCDDADRFIDDLEQLTGDLWSETRLQKPAFLTLSSTRNASKRRAVVKDEGETMSSPPSPREDHSPPPTPRAKKRKVFPIIYLNLSKKLKKYHHRRRALDDDSSDPASPSKDDDSDDEPVKIDGESLQAAYDLLMLCRPDVSPRGTDGTDIVPTSP
ncbi:hypothetical protein PHYBOEH_010099 [Phytophthora boehmeriae]|uniref:Uncharacterized protein n=1 Tax=Phytophthora boehmeriae TaxID=109152 RepID=A0A8T1VP42_9STRA|nr:hypothetical protein PHYBOEH_010099 [Phytophthora boehmeriae]